MDNNSRNVVKFIAALTFVALLIMAVRNFAESQNTEKPADVAETAAIKETLPTDVPNSAVETPDPDPQNSADDVSEEDAEITMGEPSINLEQGSPQESYDPPPPEAGAKQDQQ